MRGPHFHITGLRGWLQHDHFGTTIDGADGALRLLTREEASDDRKVCDPTTLGAWLEAHRGGFILPQSWARQDCGDGPAALVVDAEGAFSVLTLVGSVPWDGRLPESSYATTDHEGRAWFLSQDGLILRAFGPGETLEVLVSELTLPQPCDLVAVGRGGIAVARHDGELWVRGFEAPLTEVSLAMDAGELLTDIIALGHGFLALVVGDDGGRLIELRANAVAARVNVPALECPTHLVPLDDDEFLISERDGLPGTKTRFHQFRWQNGLVPIGEPTEIRGFDGRFVFTSSRGILASWDDGLRRLYGARTRYTEGGWVETVHFDSRRHLCKWDRVFLDACIPAGCVVELQARTSDTLDPSDLAATPVPPPGMSLVEGGGQLCKLIPLGPGDLDEAGWQTVYGLDDLGPNGDVPKLGVPQGARDAKWTTLEGFITNDPGRYLWLRIRLHGTRTATPRVFGARLTYPRPDMMRLLPAFWQSDPIEAKKMARFLALFEADLTRSDAFIRQLHYLFDPRTVPEEALEWLGSWVGMSLDERIPLAARRQLVREAVDLYEARGTVGGMTRVIEIVSGVDAVIIEGFRVRRKDAPILGVAGSTIVGDVLPLGGSAPVADEVTPRLVAGWRAGMARRKAHWEQHGQPCPEDSPPSPALEPGQEFYVAYAHRFTVVLSGDVCDARVDATNDAIEAWKPAHTLHSLCLTEAGMSVGRTARPGYSALRALPETGPPAAVVGENLLIGTVYTMGPHKPLRYVPEIPEETP